MTARRPRSPQRLAASDALLAVVSALVSVGELATAQHRYGPLGPELVVAAAMGGAVFWRRTAPEAAALAITGALVAEIVLLMSSHPEDRSIALSAPALCVVLVAFGAARHVAERRRVVTTFGILAVALIITAAVNGHSQWGEYVWPLVIVALVMAAGRAVLTQSLLAAGLHEEVARAQESHDVDTRLAILEERRRIAREMHDVVAHSVSVMVIQAGGARRIMDDDPARAAQAAALVEQTGREALAELRLLLGAAHPGAWPAEARRAPQPGLGAVDGLLARARDAGLAAVLREDGARVALPAPADLSAYRVVQESLTNTLKHAGPGARADVDLRWSPAALEIEVRDSGPIAASPAGSAGAVPGGGHGLLGMAERLRLLDGVLTAGPLPDGGFGVHARIPLIQEGSP